jgi:FkbM family methyltransferase
MASRSSAREGARDRAISLLRSIGKIPVPGVYPLFVDPLARRLLRGLGVVRGELFGVAVLLDSRDYVQRRAYLGCYEPDLMKYLASALAPGDWVVDVGANIGIISLACLSSIGPSGAIDCIEPVPGNLASLRSHLETFGDQVAIHPVAVGSTSGIVRIGTDLTHDGESGSSGNFRVGGEENSLDVTLDTLDHLLDSSPHGGRRVRLMKVDVEGLEPEAFAGASKTLRGSDPPDIIVCEVNPGQLTGQGHSVRDLVEPLQAAEYHLQRLTRSGRLVPAQALVVRCARRNWEHRPTLLAQAVDGIRRTPSLWTLVAVRSSV